MTREEEIKKIASAFAIDEVKDTCNPASKRGLLYVGFITGAEWADAHPTSYDGKAMLYVNNKSHENGYKEAVNKACDWLYAHLYTRRDKQSPANHFVCSKQEMLTQTEFVEQFKQAMKGE